MPDYIVEGKSRLDLRQLALEIRRDLRLENTLYFPIVEFLELLPEFFPPFYYEIVQDHELPHDVHADTDILSQYMRIKQSVYNGACQRKGRDRMTIAHEIGHFFTLCLGGYRLQRNFSQDQSPAFADPEWHAKCFGGELLIPAHLIQGMSANDIAEQCGVSLPAAKYQLSKI